MLRRVSAFGVATCLTLLAGAAQFHVAPGGGDRNAGTSQAPFATLERARDAVRTLKERDGILEGDVTVWLHAGRYERARTFALTAQDSGQNAARIVYRGMAGAEVRLVGGRTIPGDAFAPARDRGAAKRIPKKARQHVLEADLAEFGIANLGEYPDKFGEPPAIPELFFDDERMTLARWPNDGWTAIEKVIESGAAPWRGYESEKAAVFEYSGGRPSRWVDAPAVWLHGYWCFDWRSETLRVASIDTEKKQIALGEQHCYGLGSGNPAPRRYHAVNLIEELDAPGEYYIDRGTAMLYFMPPRAIETGGIVLSTLTGPVISLDDASHVTLRGVTVEACAGVGLTMRGGRENKVAACVFRNIGHDAMHIESGEKHTVVACDIHDTGQGGISIEGGGRKTLTPCGHEVVNNHIYRVSRRQRTGAYHVRLMGVGIRLAHNLLHDGPHQAIGVQGNNHVVEFNEIHHTGMETDDCGAYYMGRNPSERGTVIRHNFWHDIGSSLTHGSAAIYFDDGSGGQTVFGNVFRRAAGGTFGAVFVHGGHQNTVDNNVFIECKIAMRQAPWTDAHWRKELEGELWQRVLLEDVDITQPPYTEQYPELEGYMEPGKEPRVNYAYRNVIYKCGEFVKGNWTIVDNWIVDQPPGFEDVSAMNYKLRENSPVYERVPGFQAIPFDKIGLYEDELRPSVE